jgi:hypothetical protein
MANDATERSERCKYFRSKLARRIEPTGGPGVELVTLEDAARFIGHLRPWRQARPTWDYAAQLVLRAATTGSQRDITAATDQMERALRCDGWM